MNLSALFVTVITLFAVHEASACCAVSMRGSAVVNADQKVILLWDQAKQTQHFIRQANFRTAGESVGFLVPTPTRPQLEESGNDAFPYMASITTPKEPMHLTIPFGCSAMPRDSNGVRVIEEKTVAGYETVVLAADSGKGLIAWLNAHGYAYTKEAAAWAEPYLTTGWFITAMKLAKPSKGSPAGPATGLAAAALRITFKTDRPLFPYREPDSRADAASLGVTRRSLRIYFVAEARYEGHFLSGPAWSGHVLWSRPLSNGQRSELLQKLQLPATTGPAKFWLTAFTDAWPYGIAPGDVYFRPAATQRKLGAYSTPASMDPVLPALLALGLIRPWVKRRRR